MPFQRPARLIAIMIALLFLVQIIPYGQAGGVLADQPQSHSTARIIPYGDGVATSLIGIDQNRATVLFSHENFTNATFSSFVRVDVNDSNVAQSKDSAIAISPNGSIIIVWSQVHQGVSRAFISSSTDGGNIFSGPMLITASASGNQTEPEIAVANGVVYVVWTEFVPGRSTDIYLARSLDNGSSFGAASRVDHTGSSNSLQGFPEIAARSNDVCVVWHDLRDGASFKIYGAISHDQGQTFGPAGDILISDGPSGIDQSRPDVVYLNDGRILVIWQDRRTGDFDVRGAVSAGGISFSPSFRVSDGPANTDQSDPRLVIDPRGFVSVAWRDNRYVIGYHILVSTSMDGVHYGASMRVDDAPLATSCFSPDVTASKNGSAFIAWSDGRTGINQVYFKAIPNLAPLVMITTPVEGAARKGSFPINGTASDPERSPQLSVDVQLQDSAGSNLTPWSNVPLAVDGTWRTSINSSHFANGTIGSFRIAARSFDGLVHSRVAIVNVTFDNSRPPYVELTLTSDRVRFDPSEPMALQNVTISAEIYNLGTMNATNVSVGFSWQNDTASEVIGERTLANVSSGDHATAFANWIAIQGDFTIIVQADPMNVIDEENETNNTARKDIHVEPARPDVLVLSSGITIPPDPIYSGDAINFSAVIVNQGEKLASSFAIVFSVNGTPITTIVVNELLPHHSVNATSNWNAVGGPHVLEVVADPSHTLDDANFANNAANVAFNVQTIPRPMADLTVTNGTLLISPNESMNGELLVFSAFISNIGNAPANDVNVTFYVDDVAIEYRSIAQINGSESVGISAFWTAMLGQHNVSVVIDPDHLIQERNNSNNAVIKSYIVTEWVQKLPDLAVSQADIAMPSDPIMGSVVWINVTIHNVGNAGAARFLVLGEMDGVELGHLDVNYLPGNSSLVVAFTWFANEGQHVFKVTIDPSHTVTETTISNNTATKTVSLSGHSDSTSLFIAAGFFIAAIGVMAFYFLRVRKK